MIITNTLDWRIVSIGCAFLFFGCNDPVTKKQTPPVKPIKATKTPEIKTPTTPTTPKKANVPVFLRGIPGEGQLHVQMETNMGTIQCLLYEKKAPKTVENFVGLARGMKSFLDPETNAPITNRPYYNGITFHRIIPKFMIQAGDPTGTGRGGPGYTIKDEFHPKLRHDKAGVLSMANAGPDTGGSQFFITLNATPHLDGKHSIFGQCHSLSVITSISNMPTNANNRPPKKTPTIKSMSFSRIKQTSPVP